MTRAAMPARLAAALLYAGAATAGPFQADDLLALAELRHAAVSPDGEAVAVSVSRPDAAADVRIDELHVIVRGREVTEPAVIPDAGFATWSEDGRRLHFVAKDAGRVELRAYDRASRTTEVIARLPSEPVHVAWSPRETRVALVVDRPAGRHDWLLPADASPAGREPRVADHAVFRAGDGAWLPATERRLVVIEIATGRVQELALPADVSLAGTEAGDGGPPAWTADGAALVVSVARGFDAASNLWNVNRDLLELRLDGRQPSWVAESPVVESDPAVSPDGTYVAYLRQRGAPEETVFHRDLVVRDLGRAHERLAWTAGDRDVRSFAWASDASLLAVYVDRARVVLSSLDLAGKERRLSVEADIATILSPPARDGAVAFIRSLADRPPEAATVDASGAVTEWSAFNEALRGRVTSAVTEIDFPSAHADGRLIHALVARPRDAEDPRSLPVVVDLHGGPYWARTFNYDATREFFVSRGYVVVQPNYRGSVGYGSAFSRLSDRKRYPGRFDEPDAPSEMGLDVVGALDAVARLGLGDASRACLRGVSAGALLASWTIGRTGRFAAAAANSWYPGEFDGADYGSFQIRRYFGGPPWDPAHQPEYWSRQPLMLAGRMETPLLLLHGERDWVTPLGEAEKFYYALRSAGLDVVLAVFPDETHGLERHPWSARNALLMELEWFRRHHP